MVAHPRPQCQIRAAPTGVLWQVIDDLRHEHARFGQEVPVTGHHLRRRWASDLAKWLFAEARDLDNVGVRDDVVRLTRLAGGVEHVGEAEIGPSFSDALERAHDELARRIGPGAVESNGST